MTTMLSTKQVAARPDVPYTDTTIRIYEKDGRFPPADERIDGRMFWYSSTIDAWAAGREDT